MLFEIFDETESILEYENLKPKLGKSSHTFRVGEIIVHFMDLDTLRPFRIGNEHLTVQLFELNEKGNFAVLKKGLGVKPVEVISTIMHLVKEFVKVTKPESIQFRFNNLGLKGKKGIILKIVSRLVKNRLKQYSLVPEIGDIGKKYSYVIATKNVDSLISDDFVKTSEGYLSKSEKVVVNKEKAVAKSIEARHEAIDDKALAKIVSRRVLIKDKGNENFVQHKKSPVHSASDIEREHFDVEFPAAESFSKNIKSVFISYNSKDMEVFSNKFKTIYNDFALGKTDSVDFLETVVGNAVEAKLTVADTKKFLTNLFQTSITKNIGEAFKNSLVNHKPMHRSPETKHALSYYSLNGDKVMSLLLRGQLDEVKSHIKANKDIIINSLYIIETDERRKYTVNQIIKDSYKKIDAIDSAFETGAKIDLPLYRAHIVSLEEFEQIINSGVMVFENYVSTSLLPLPFMSSYFSNSSHALQTPGNFDDLDSTSQVKLGLIITGVDKIKTIPMGADSKILGEVEVLLPRGSVFEVKSVKVANDIAYGNQAVLYLEVKDPKYIIEQKQFKDFVKFKEKSILASLLSLNLPRKFVE